MRLVLPAVLSTLALLAGSVAANASFAADRCLPCHERKTPGIVRYWKESVHFEKKITCVGCHGDNVEANHQRAVTVDAAKCGTCHRTELSDHHQSKHGIGLRAGRACTRNGKKTDEQQKSCTHCHEPNSAKPRVAAECAMFLAQSPEMQRQGCTACHLVETRCDTCHTKHGTDLALARDPHTCGACHMGPDHPQLEMWETSRHGILYDRSGKDTAPSCVTCHMKDGSHNVSRGVNSGRTSDAEKKRERDFMIATCSGCHTSAFSERNLSDADKIEEQSMALVAEAGRIIEGLEQDGLLSPSTAERPGHPLFGKSFVIGPQMLYENLSSVESLYFKMKQFYASTAYKGAFHQNPDYAHWYGNAPLKLTLSEIKSEAALLRKIDTLRKEFDALGLRHEKGEFDGIGKELRSLKEKRLKGEINDQEYQQMKKTLLDASGL